jgi:hypothetical protein
MATATQPQSLLLTNPLARTVAELADYRQLRLIRETALQAGVDADEECSRVTRMACRVEELSQDAAEEFIRHLKAVEER